MSKENTKPRITSAQTSVLCTFFEENPEVVRGYKKTPDTVDTVQKKWKCITPQLNSLGPSRNCKAWAKYLCNVKSRLKSRKIKWEQKSDGSGPIICDADNFNEIELRLLQVMSREGCDEPSCQVDEQELENINTKVKDEEPQDEQELENINTKVKDEQPQVSEDVNSEEYKDINHTSPFYIKIPDEGSPDMIYLQRLYKMTQNIDEFDTFGQNIAQQLRTMPLEVALETEELIISVLRKQRLKSFNNHNGDPLNTLPD